MVRILTLLLALWTGPALAQGAFVTPAVSPWTGVGVTQDTSPWAVNGGVTVNGTVTTSPVAGIPTVVISPATGTGFTIVQSGTLQVNIVGGSTIPVSLTGPVTVTASLTTSPAVIASLSAGLPTIVTSPVAGQYPVSVVGTVTTSAAVTSAVTPVSIGATVTTSDVAGGNYPVTVLNTVTTSPTAGTYPVNIVAASASPFIVQTSGTTTVSQATTPPTVAEEGLGYPGRANFFSQSVSSAAATTTVLVNQSGTNKAYVTGIQCSRSDTTTASVLLGFNNVSSGTSLYIRLPSVSAPGEGDQAQVALAFNPPAPTAASTSLQFTPTAVVSGSFNCNAQGYYAP